MRQVVVLVGLPGSGKTAFHRKFPEWAVVSKDALRHGIFRHSFNPAYEEVVDRIFAHALVEAIDSSADVVCIDDVNLLRAERASYIELAELAGREAVAVVMPHEPLDVLYENVQSDLEQLSICHGDAAISVTPFPRERFDAMVRCYQAVQPDEGFVQIEHETRLSRKRETQQAAARPKRTRRKREEKQAPIPLFAT